jgi:thymidylate synthase
MILRSFRNPLESGAKRGKRCTEQESTAWRFNIDCVLALSKTRQDRTGTAPTCSAQARTAWKVFPGHHQKEHLKSIIYELLWLRGATNIKYFNEHGAH